MFIKRTIRVHRRDSAFVYAILESLEGMASYSTLPDAPCQDFREIELCIAPAFLGEIETVIGGMRKRFPIIEVNHADSI
jgi:hypothetical protein